MKQLLSEPATSLLYGGSRPDLIRSETLADIFAATAARLPAKTALALIGQNQTLNYAELDRRSTKVAEQLAARGVKRGDFVGLWFKRSLDLHVAMIGIVKSGATFIPFDADAPAERIATSLFDCGSSAILSHGALAAETAKLPVAVFDLDALLAEPAGAATPQGPTPDGVAYAIYTSGSTGKPKGITITHRNIAHYLRSGNVAIGMREDDIVFQGASVAFDLSMEEIWIPYLVGATLKVAPNDVLKDTDRLPETIVREGVTVLDVVPTMLTMLDRDMESVRLIITGGEAMTPALVDRWSKPGRRILNTYGPTETTVVATFAECEKGRPVTIGRPIPNYTAYVVNEALEPVGPNETGELLIGGPGVAQGYINLPEMTAKKFIANPFGSEAAGDRILYRTGDAVSVDAYGDIHFHGRIDDQVKIRGYRIELGEIEALIAAEPQVKAAAVAVHKDGAGGDVLVAHVVAADGFDAQATKKALVAKLPPYMVPPLWRTHSELPRMISGKVDRKALSAMLLDMTAASEPQEEPRTETEAALLASAQKIFAGQSIPFEADFFTELGGHSLIAARFISAVRETPSLAGITLQDVYQQRTLRKLAAALDDRRGGDSEPPANLRFSPPPFSRRFWCGLAQTATLPLILGLSTAQWLGVFLTYMMFLQGTSYTFLHMVLVLTGAYAGIKFGSLFLVIALKWLVIGKVRPGRYPLWGAYYFRWWLVSRLYALANPSYLANSPIMRFYLRALGAQVGNDAMIAHAEFGAPDLIEIGSWASIGHKAVIANAEIVGGELIIGRVSIGDRAYIGNQVVVASDCVIGHDAYLDDLTALQPGTVVEPFATWDGSPGRKTGMLDPAELPATPEASRARKGLLFAAYATLVVLVQAIGLLPIFPAFFVFDKAESFVLDNLPSVEWYHVLFPLAWLMSGALVVFTLAIVIALRWIIMPTRLKEGRFSIHSGLHLRQWLMNLISEVSLDTLSSLYATTYMRAWYRLMGARIGKGAEISTNLGGRYDLISIGSNSFMADECVLGDEDVQRGWMTLRRTVIEDRVFVGNNAVVPHGSHLKEGTLIGVKSKVPESGVTEPGETWFGSPPIKFPVRQTFGGVGSSMTYEPSRAKKFLRAAFEALHTTFPTALFITLGSISVEFIEPRYANSAYASALGVFLIASCVMPVMMTIAVAAIKWLTMGAYKPVSKPMWSFWAMRTEAVAVLYWGLAGRVLLDHLKGTFWLPMFLRLFGTKVGKGVYMNTTDLTEFDCCSIGDYAVMNDLSCLQTHLYEDRVMKVGRVEIGEGVSIGAFSTVLYDTKIGDYAQIGNLSLIMKGENLPAQTCWAGAPAQPVRSGHQPALTPAKELAAAA
ncbi:MAG: peptide synthetase [Rhizobiales bacterium 65-9]|nr:amino acid adenylation domain-containing protein [Hyphomicrobiales bacterium]OJY35723.1 MAG: peptide synthetase [Rhizobiales bacterium 65-9]